MTHIHVFKGTHVINFRLRLIIFKEFYSIYSSNVLKIGIQTLNYIYFILISILHSLENIRSLGHECILISLVYK